MGLRKIDGHVHLLGDGSSGSGCWFNLKGPWSQILARILIKEIGLPQSVLKKGGTNLDQLYAERLLQQVRDSSLDAILLLAQEVPRDSHGTEMVGVGAFYVPNDYLLDLCSKNSEFIPAVSIHPARPDALDELEKCLQAGARIMKCLPNCQNIDCNDKRFSPFWTRMAEAGMILLAHTGGEMSLPVINSHYADPRTLTLPLECGVTVIAAHCAGRSCFWDADYTHRLLEMLPRYPNLYADNSAFCSPIRSRSISTALKPELAGRIIQGSDYPIPVSGFGPWLRGRLDWQDYRKWENESNVLERDYQFKRALGFPPDTFTLLDSLMSRR